MLDWRGGSDPERSVFLSQRDVRELQFAKASIATGWSILLGELGVEAGDISQVLLAGSFGAYLTPLERGPDRAGAEDRAAPDRVRRQRRRRGRQDRGAVGCASAPRRTRSCGRSSTSSCRAGRTSTTCSSTSWPSRDEDRRRRAAVLACGALAARCAPDRAAARLGPRRASQCRRCCTTTPSASPRPSAELSRRDHDVVAVAYGDCGTLRRARRARRAARWGALLRRCSLGDEVRAALDEEPGTYFLTDFLARTFEHTVWRELGLDRYPELRDDYFGNYTRVDLARAAADAGHARGGAAGRGAARAAARGARGREQGLGAGTRAAGRPTATHPIAGTAHARSALSTATPASMVHTPSVRLRLSRSPNRK